MFLYHSKILYATYALLKATSRELLHYRSDVLKQEKINLSEIIQNTEPLEKHTVTDKISGSCHLDGKLNLLLDY